MRNINLVAITMTPESTLVKNDMLSIHDPASYDGFICTNRTFMFGCGHDIADVRLSDFYLTGFRPGKHAIL